MTDFRTDEDQVSRLELRRCLMIGSAIASAAIGAAGSIASSQIAGNAAKSASNTQVNFDQEALQVQQQINQANIARLQPWVNAGNSANSALMFGLGIGTDGQGNPTVGTGSSGSGAASNGLQVGGAGTFGGLTTPFNPTQAQLAQTPGYQFTLSQGLNAVNNQYAAQGQGPGTDASGNRVASGPAAAGAATFAEGLASQTYQQQFNDYQASNAQIFNELSGVNSLGEAAAAGAGALSQNSATAQAGTLGATGNASAGGTVAQGSANSGAAAGVAGNASQLAMLYGLLGTGGAGGAANASSLYGNYTGAAINNGDTAALGGLLGGVTP